MYQFANRTTLILGSPHVISAHCLHGSADVLDGGMADPETVVVHNVHVYTPVGREVRSYTGLVIENGKVRQLLDVASPLPTTAQRIDGGGKTLLPGLIDAHGHVLSLGQQQLQVDLRGAAWSLPRLNEQARLPDPTPPIAGSSVTAGIRCCGRANNSRSQKISMPSLPIARPYSPASTDTPSGSIVQP